MPTCRATDLTADHVRGLASDARRQAIIEAIYPDLRKLCRKSSMLKGTAAQFDTIDDAVQEAVVGLIQFADRYDPDRISPRTGRPIKPLTVMLWHIRAYMQKQLTKGRRQPTTLSGTAARRVTMAADCRASDGDPAMVLGVPVQREMFR